MNETDRRKIFSNMDELSNKLPYDLLKQEFRKKGVFSDTMIREIEVGHFAICISQQNAINKCNVTGCFYLLYFLNPQFPPFRSTARRTRRRG